MCLLSGDAPARVDALAGALGIPAAHALGGRTPDDKARRWRGSTRADALYLGDGVNDASPSAQALCAGTPAIDRPVLPGSSDFFLLGEGLGAAARRAGASRTGCARVVRRIWRSRSPTTRFAVVAALRRALMPPVRAAISCRCSSLSVLLLTVVAAARRPDDGRRDRAGVRQPAARRRLAGAVRLQRRASATTSTPTASPSCPSKTTPATESPEPTPRPAPRCKRNDRIRRRRRPPLHRRLGRCSGSSACWSACSSPRQLAFWQANFGIPYLTFGRLRPLHTNAVIFAFVGNMMFAGIYYSTQRLLKARMASDAALEASTSGAGRRSSSPRRSRCRSASRTGKEYAELEWPIDIAIAVIWVVFAINFFWTLAKRNEKHLYVAIWFYIATIITVAVLHIVNSLALPRRRDARATRSSAACRMRWCSGGTGTTPSRSS